MNHDVLKAVIYDQRRVIREAAIVPRRYSFDPAANYVVTGLRRAGKTTLLYDQVQKLVADGVDWNRIIYVNFEDERLAEFALQDFNDILLVQAQMSEGRGVFFFDEVQNVPGWERFARRLADAGERVYITGSNARMLSGEVESRLGGRYLSMHVDPYRFDEYLRALGRDFDDESLHASRRLGRVQEGFERYLHDGGLPESLRYRSPRAYVESVYQKVLLGDIVARNGLRDARAMRLLMKKVAETVRSEVSYSALHGALRGIGLSVSKDTVIGYLGHVQDAYLAFPLFNYASRFAESQGNPKWYFSDNGILNLFLLDRDTALLENVVAVALAQRYGRGLYYLKSDKTGIDVDFIVPEAGVAVQAAYSIEGGARDREVGNLVRLAKAQPDVRDLVIATMGQEDELVEDGVRVRVVPAWRLLLELAS